MAAVAACLIAPNGRLLREAPRLLRASRRAIDLAKIATAARTASNRMEENNTAEGSARGRPSVLHQTTASTFTPSQLRRIYADPDSHQLAASIFFKVEVRMCPSEMPEFSFGRGRNQISLKGKDAIREGGSAIRAILVARAIATLLYAISVPMAFLLLRLSY
jgi:hypothetical protein